MGAYPGGTVLSSRSVRSTLQDYLCLGNEARMNTPSTLGDNWKWRLTRGQLTDEIIHRINAMTRLYGRIQENKK